MCSASCLFGTGSTWANAYPSSPISSVSAEIEFFDLVGVVDVALLGLQQFTQLLRLQIRNPQLEADLAEIVPLALLDREGDDEAFAIRGQLGDGRADVEIGVAAGEVVAAQELLIERDPVRIVGVVAAQEAIPCGLLGLDHAAQIVVIERLIADEHDPRHLGERPFVDLEHQVDPVLRQLDHLGLDGRREPAVAPVELEDAADRVLHARARIDHARPQLQLGLECLVVQAPVSLERDPVDDRVLDHRHDQPIALAAQRDVVEQTGCEQVLERAVELDRIERIAHRDREIAADRRRLDPLIALDLDLLDHAPRGAHLALLRPSD